MSCSTRRQQDGRWVFSPRGRAHSPSAFSSISISVVIRRWRSVPPGCFGVQLPLNFNSPYRALSIDDFWRRWHMTLSRFLRDYVYFPLGGSRRGQARHYLNLLVTMTVSGLWHGAAWHYGLWGGVHGIGRALPSAGR